MLLQFSVQNFKSIKNYCAIDFRKTNATEHKESLIMNEVLPVTVFYGPNAAGKSTIIQALTFLIKLVFVPVENNRFMVDGKQTPYIMPSYKTYQFDEKTKNGPTFFNILFTIGNDLEKEYSYSLELIGGNVNSESLYEKGSRGRATKIYERKENIISFGTYYSDLKLGDKLISPSIPFLSTAAIFFNETIFGKITNYFANILSIDYSEPNIEKAINIASLNYLNNNEIKHSITKILQSFNLGLDGYEVVSDSNGNIQTVKTIHKDGVLLLEDESMGTKKLMMALPPIYISLYNGTPLLIDELDAKIHPKLLEFIISLFTNPKINTKGAQLIFTSHDIYTLNNQVFRRDEVWFVAKDLEDSTFCYSLIDIRNEDNERERKDATYSKRYMEGRYGADPYFIKMKSWEDIND